jgi:hypothetical protein
MEPFMELSRLRRAHSDAVVVVVAPKNGGFAVGPLPRSAISTIT